MKEMARYVLIIYTSLKHPNIYPPKSDLEGVSRDNSTDKAGLVTPELSFSHCILLLVGIL